jgi:hypothetical protein
VSSGRATCSTTIEREPLIQAFLRSPLRHIRYREGHGTAYTAVYRAVAPQLESAHRWSSDHPAIP